jgi:hypothetical protein
LEELRLKFVGCAEAFSSETPVSEVMQDNEVIAQAREVQATYEQELLNIPGVVGVGIGLEQGEVVLKVFLEEMTAQLAQALPGKLEGFSVVPEVTGKFVAF